MQMTAAGEGSGPAHGPGLPVARPVLPAPAIRKSMTVKKPPAKVSRVTASPTAPRKDSIPASPGALPVLPDTGRPGCGPVPQRKSRPLSPPAIVRPRPISVSRRISKSNPFVEQDIPLYLVPAIIARAIWQQGEQTFRISVIRTKQHYYTIRLRTARPKNRAGTKPGRKSRCTTGALKTPGKTPNTQPSSKPAEMPNP